MCRVTVDVQVGSKIVPCAVVSSASVTTMNRCRVSMTIFRLIGKLKLMFDCSQLCNLFSDYNYSD